jgi:hypothetical protein
MKIIKVQALRGPNIWSIKEKKLIQMHWIGGNGTISNQ